MNDNEWQRVVILAFLFLREEPTTMYPKENSLNIEEDRETIIRTWKDPWEALQERLLN